MKVKVAVLNFVLNMSALSTFTELNDAFDVQLCQMLGTVTSFASALFYTQLL